MGAIEALPVRKIGTISRGSQFCGQSAVATYFCKVSKLFLGQIVVFFRCFSWGAVTGNKRETPMLRNRVAKSCLRNNAYGAMLTCVWHAVTYHAPISIVL